jgi:hypothetical protein
VPHAHSKGTKGTERTKETEATKRTETIETIVKEQYPNVYEAWLDRTEEEDG